MSNFDLTGNFSFLFQVDMEVEGTTTAVDIVVEEAEVEDMTVGIKSDNRIFSFVYR